MSQILVVWSLLPVASRVDVESKHMNWTGALWIAFHIRVHFDVVLTAEISLFDSADSSIVKLFQLSHCLSKRFLWAVIKCLSFGDRAMQDISSSSLSRMSNVVPVFTSITLTLEPWIQNKYFPHEVTQTRPPVYWVSLTCSTLKL